MGRNVSLSNFDSSDDENQSIRHQRRGKSIETDIGKDLNSGSTLADL